MDKGEPRIPLISPAVIGSSARFRINSVYTDIKIAYNTKINHIMVYPLLIIIMPFLLIDFPQKLKFKSYFNNSLLLYSSSPQLQRLFFFY